MDHKRNNTLGSPIVIGGVGGSGTRIIARIISEMGFDMGRDLNKPNDDLWFNLLFFRPERFCSGAFDIEASVIPGFRLMENHRFQTPYALNRADCRFLFQAILDLRKTDNFGNQPLAWCLRRLRNYFLPKTQPPSGYSGWGWKEPASHLILPHLLSYYQNGLYIHVIRHGLDMALSDNLNQVAKFGSLYDLKDVSAASALKFWLRTNKAAFEHMKAHPERTMTVTFEELCQNPTSVINRLAKFVNYNCSLADKQRFVNYIHVPESIGRYRNHSLDAFEADDLSQLSDLGYKI